MEGHFGGPPLIMLIAATVAYLNDLYEYRKPVELFEL